MTEKKPLPIPIIKTDDPVIALQIIKDLNERLYPLLKPLKQYDETIPLDMFIPPLMDWRQFHRLEEINYKWAVPWPPSSAIIRDLR